MNLKDFSVQQLHKIVPKINFHDYKLHNYYLYVYLDPFMPKEKVYKLPLNSKDPEELDKNYTFYFRPIYIGKASNKGYRHNQHIASFLTGPYDEAAGTDEEVYNVNKRSEFISLQNKMKLVKEFPEKFDSSIPMDWKDYQRDWIMILDSFDNHEDLVKAEAAIIKEIGTIKKGNGPLVNILLG